MPVLISATLADASRVTSTWAYLATVAMLLALFGMLALGLALTRVRSKFGRQVLAVVVVVDALIFAALVSPGLLALAS